MNFGGVMSDQLVNDIPTIPASGMAVKTSTKMTAGRHVQQSGQSSTSSGGHSVSTAGLDLLDGRWHTQW